MKMWNSTKNIIIFKYYQIEKQQTSILNILYIKFQLIKKPTDTTSI